MKYEIKITAQFKKDLKTARRRHYNLSLLQPVIDLLAEGQTLPSRYRDHILSGSYLGYHECHITPDWLLVYKIDRSALILVLQRTGTHSDLF